MDSIEAITVFSHQELVQGMLLHEKYKNSIFRVFRIAGVILIAGYIVLSIFLRARFPALVQILCLGMWLVVTAWVRTSMIRQRLKKHPSLNSVIHWTLDDQGVSGEEEGSNFRVSWTRMHEAIVTDLGLLVYPQEGMFHWIPRSGFQSDTDYDRAKGLVRNNVAKCRVDD